jgi:hypothetical protein
MNRHPVEFRCDLCRRVVGDELRARARGGWAPLIICGACLRQAGSIDERRGPAPEAAR